MIFKASLCDLTLKNKYSWCNLNSVYFSSKILFFNWSNKYNFNFKKRFFKEIKTLSDWDSFIWYKFELWDRYSEIFSWKYKFRQRYLSVDLHLPLSPLFWPVCSYNCANMVNALFLPMTISVSMAGNHGRCHYKRSRKSCLFPPDVWNKIEVQFNKLKGECQSSSNEIVGNKYDKENFVIL